MESYQLRNTDEDTSKQGFPGLYEQSRVRAWSGGTVIYTDAGPSGKSRLRSHGADSRNQGQGSLGCVTSKGLWGQGPPPSQSVPCPPCPALKGVNHSIVADTGGGSCSLSKLAYHTGPSGKKGAENSLCEFCEWKWPYCHQSEKWGEKPCGHRTHDPGAPGSHSTASRGPGTLAGTQASVASAPTGQARKGAVLHLPCDSRQPGPDLAFQTAPKIFSG